MKQSKEQLQARYRNIRQASCDMCSPLTPEQCRIQPIPEVSPPWWNLAHTSWFFVRNVLEPFKGTITKEDALFNYILNSYYVSFGPRLERSKRGLMTRPSMEEVYHYRQSVDNRIIELINNMENMDEKKFSALAEIIHIGLEHERQHQELFYTEIKYILYQNPLELRQAYQKRDVTSAEESTKNNKESIIQSQFLDIKGGLLQFGNLETNWGWDNEFPVHQYFQKDFALSNKLVTNGEYLAFIDDNGYTRQKLWLDNGWQKVETENWQAPLYWEKIDNQWMIWTLNGMRKLDLLEPVCHISFYEAEAFARWREARLPTEREWEQVARNNQLQFSNFIHSNQLHPIAARVNENPFTQMLGDVWEWTSSYYEPYPGYRPFQGNLQEYTQKFMDNQRVLRGGSCVSESDHIRISYRNYWPPETRFQFTGIRLAKDL